jgi:hypothetical protein
MAISIQAPGQEAAPAPEGAPAVGVGSAALAGLVTLIPRQPMGLSHEVHLIWLPVRVSDTLDLR